MRIHQSDSSHKGTSNAENWRSFLVDLNKLLNKQSSSLYLIPAGTRTSLQGPIAETIRSGRQLEGGIFEDQLKTSPKEKLKNLENFFFFLGGGGGGGGGGCVQLTDLGDKMFWKWAFFDLEDNFWTFSPEDFFFNLKNDFWTCSKFQREQFEGVMEAFCRLSFQMVSRHLVNVFISYDLKWRCRRFEDGNLFVLNTLSKRLRNISAWAIWRRCEDVLKAVFPKILNAPCRRLQIS